MITSKRSAGRRWLKLRGRLKREQDGDGSCRGPRLFGNELSVDDDEDDDDNDEHHAMNSS